MEKSLISQAKVRVIGHTKPNDEELDVEAQSLVSYVARVSNPSNQMNFETEEKLLGYLMRNAHWSPLEMVNITMEVTTTRDIARQILRHRSFSFQEFSQRYADPTADDAGLGFVTREARLQDPKNRQNSLEISEVPFGEELSSQWELKQLEIIKKAEEVYKWAIDNGIAKEQARAVLPEGLTVSRLYMQGSLRSWIHYCMLREAHGTQKEHIEVAKLCLEEIFKLYPFVKNAWSSISGK
jgi:thymidylate synthase (FAD)